MAKYLDEAGAAYLISKTVGLLNKKVDKEEGKTLSSEDFTSSLKIKLNNLENYSLPIASNENLGGIKIGDGLTIDSETGELTAQSATNKVYMVEEAELYNDTIYDITATEDNPNKMVFLFGGGANDYKAGIDYLTTSDYGKTFHIDITFEKANIGTNGIRFYEGYSGTAILLDELTHKPVVEGETYSFNYTMSSSNITFLRMRLNEKTGDQKFNVKIKSISEIEKILGNADPLPSYCLEEIEKIKRKVLDEASYNDTVFGLFTDLHFSDNDSVGNDAQKWNTIKCMRKIADETILDFVVQGGDLLSKNLYVNDCYKLNKTQTSFSGCRVPLFTSKGDHDSNQTDTKISKSNFAKRTAPYMPKAIRCDQDPNNYYFDLPEKKTRFINIDSGTLMAGQTKAGADYISQSVDILYSWLLDDVFSNDVKDGWRFIVFSHAPCDLDWNWGMVQLEKNKSVPTSSLLYSKNLLLKVHELLNAINTNGTFTITASNELVLEKYETTLNSDGVIISATPTNDSITSENQIRGIVTGANNGYSKDFSNWTSKAKLIVSGHCHCDRLNKETLLPDGSGGYERKTLSYAIGYTGSAAYNGIKKINDYYIPCFGTDGVIASWGHIASRSLGTLGAYLMDVWIVGDTYVKRIRFGAGKDNALLDTNVNI